MCRGPEGWGTNEPRQASLVILTEAEERTIEHPDGRTIAIYPVWRWLCGFESKSGTSSSILDWWEIPIRRAGSFPLILSMVGQCAFAMDIDKPGERKKGTDRPTKPRRIQFPFRSSSRESPSRFKVR